MPDVITGLELGRERLNGAALCMSSPICGQRRGKNENEDDQECELPFHRVPMKDAARVDSEIARHFKVEDLGIDHSSPAARYCKSDLGRSAPRAQLELALVVNEVGWRFL